MQIKGKRVYGCCSFRPRISNNKYHWRVYQDAAIGCTACIIRTYDGAPPRWLWSSRQSSPLSSGGWFHSWHIPLIRAGRNSEKTKVRSYTCDIKSRHSTAHGRRGHTSTPESYLLPCVLAHFILSGSKTSNVVHTFSCVHSCFQENTHSLPLRLQLFQTVHSYFMTLHSRGQQSQLQEEGSSAKHQIKQNSCNSQLFSAVIHM